MNCPLHVCDLLLDRIDDLDLADDALNTPAHFACKYDVSVALLNALLGRGADPNRRNKSGESHFLLALYANRPLVVFAALLAHGAQVGEAEEAELKRKNNHVTYFANRVRSMVVLLDANSHDISSKASRSCVRLELLPIELLRCLQGFIAHEPIVEQTEKEAEETLRNLRQHVHKRYYIG